MLLARRGAVAGARRVLVGGISVVGSASAAAVDGSVTTAPVTYPSITYLENDLVVVGIDHASTRTHTPPTAAGGQEDYTVIEATGETGDSTTAELTTYYHRVTGAEATTWTGTPPTRSWTTDAGTRQVVGVIILRGVNATTALDVTETENNVTSASTTMTGTGLTTVTNGALVVLVVGHSYNGTAANSFTSSDVTERVDQGTTSGSAAQLQSVFIGTTVQATAGATGNKVATAANSGKYAAQVIALRPA